MTSDNNDRAPKARHSRADREGPPQEVIAGNRQQATFAVIPGAAPDLTSDFNLAVLGYEETEYAVEGRAVSFELQGERGADGRWEVTTGPGATFRTRILVRRPVDAARFSGTAVVEWHNVSGGLDVGPGWGFVHRHIAARGHAWVGVAVQKAGIDGGAFVNRLHLKRLAPDRYADLDHPGDAWSFDIFTQVGRQLRLPGDQNPLRGLEPSKLLAMGESQGAAYLVTYVNAVDRYAQVFDGFFVHGRPGAGVAIDGEFNPPSHRGGLEGTVEAISARGERIREDTRVPVLLLQSETDVILLGGGLAAQPDTERIRTWELAGAAHGDTYRVTASRKDDGTLSAEQLADLLRPTRKLFMDLTDSHSPYNAGPQQHYVAQAALDHLDRWAAGGDAPPSAPRIDLDETRTRFLLDEYGLARGGIRTPWVEAPTAMLSGLGQSGESFAVMFGRTEPFDDAALSILYPGGMPEYLARFTGSLDAAIADGFVLSDDRDEILGIAAAPSSFPLQLVEG